VAIGHQPSLARSRARLAESVLEITDDLLEDGDPIVSATRFVAERRELEMQGSERLRSGNRLGGFKSWRSRSSRACEAPVAAMSSARATARSEATRSRATCRMPGSVTAFAAPRSRATRWSWVIQVSSRGLM
jgi:hypothetical protein